MIKNENDFLGAVLKYKDKNNCCSISKIMKSENISDMDCMFFIKSLKSKGIIDQIDLSTIRATPLAISTYESKFKKFLKLCFKSSVSLLKFIITYVLGIASGLIIAYLAHKFGW